MSSSLYRQYHNSTQYHLSNILVDSCLWGDFERIQYITSSPEISKHADISFCNFQCIVNASYNGYAGIVKYLLEQVEIKHPSELKYVQKSALESACNNGKLNVVTRIIDMLKDSSELFTLKSSVLLTACKEGQLDIVKYLISTIEAHDLEKYFIVSCKSSNLEMVKYFIYDLDIERTDLINEALKKRANKEIKNMFELRELNKSLNKDLAVNLNDKKKNKI